jgi:glycosyltransferase involved in cell wall biosynthesis
MNETVPGRLDVVMPARNAAATISESLMSALASPLCRRIHVVDDASSDETADVVQVLAKRSRGRVGLTRLSEHCGQAYARNVGVALSASELIAFLDADDVYEPQALEIAYNAHDGLKDLALVRLALKPVGLDPEFVTHPGFKDAWMRVAFAAPGNIVVRRSVLTDAGGFPEDDDLERQCGQDVALLQAVTRTCRVGALFTGPGVLYRVREDCSALRLLRHHLSDAAPARDAEPPRMDAAARRIAQRLRLLSPYVAAQPAVVGLLASQGAARPVRAAAAAP